MTRTVVILQARMGSTRLPGKVLAQLGDRTVLEHCLGRALDVPGIDAVCLATSDLTIDDPIADLVMQMAGVILFRGHPTDVLHRYRDAAVATDADVVVRITCDCPLIDPDVCSAVLRLRASANASFASNNATREWPHGLDCEVFTWDALKAAVREATAAYDREHVGPWMRRAAGTSAPHLAGPGGKAAQHRWTLDYPEDLAFFRALWPLLPSGRRFAWQEVASILEHHPEIVAINAMRSDGIAASDASGHGGH
jgi:spore coat polysaccharide biosynthesis protein SpsF (cytidylyltransferase family)